MNDSGFFPFTAAASFHPPSSRARELANDAEQWLARALAADAKPDAHDPTGRMLTACLVGGWRAAYAESLRFQRAGAKKEVVRAALKRWLERAFAMTSAAAEGTPYC